MKWLEIRMNGLVDVVGHATYDLLDNKCSMIFPVHMEVGKTTYF